MNINLTITRLYKELSVNCSSPDAQILIVSRRHERVGKGPDDLTFLDRSFESIMQIRRRIFLGSGNSMRKD